MKKEYIEEIRKASNDYRLNSKYMLTENILQYIKERIIVNKDEIKKLIELKKDNFVYENIESVINNEIDNSNQYKEYKDLKIDKKINFMSVKILMPVGIIAIEAYDTIEVIKYFIKAIQSRDGVVISDIEYDDTNVKTFIMEIIKECLMKFNVSENLIDIIPYEECNYKYFDKTIFTYDEYGNKYVKNKYKIKTRTDNNYIYIDDESFIEKAKKDNENIDCKIVRGDINSVIEQLNKEKSNGVVIYTSNNKNAYKFINLIDSQNVFVNASLENTIHIEEIENDMYEYKKIIIPIPCKITENNILDEKKLYKEQESKKVSLQIKKKSKFIKYNKKFSKKNI